MSLAVWLPLNGDLHNQGLNNINITNTNATLDDNGKIGKCYNFNGSNNYIKGNTFLNNNSTAFSFSWVNFNSISGNQCLFSNRTVTSEGGFSIFYGSGAFRFDSGSRWSFTSPVSISTNTWYHFCFTWEKNKNENKKYYCNGELKETTTSNSIPSAANTTYFSIGGSQASTNGNGTGNFLNAKINDVRIYDHCLSPKEVEEISKGLILHYPLNNNGLGNANLALNTFYEMRPYTISSYYTKINNSTDFFNLSIGDTYTCRAKITAGEKDTCLRIQFYTDDNKTNIFGNWVPAGTTGYSTITSTLTAEQRSYSQMRILLSDDVKASTSGEYGELKLEKGSIATPWCPNNINTNIIYDTSGYCNNGTIVGDIATIAPSPRYNCCIEHLDSCADYICREYLSFLGDSGFTFSCWINPTSYSRTTNTTTAVGNQFILSQGRDAITSGTNNTYGASLIINNGKPKFLCGNGNLDSNTIIPIGEWAHVVGVWTGTQKKIYVNGILKNSANNTGIDWIEAQNSLVIGKMAYGKNSTGAYHPFVGKISDVRIYATALTDNQIKELYNTSMQIDSSGNVFARELVEL